MQLWLVVTYDVSAQDHAIQEESPQKGAMRVTAGFGRGVKESFPFLWYYAAFLSS